MISSLLASACVAELGNNDDGERDDLDLVGTELRASRVALEFDVMGYSCPAGGAVCGTEADKCICQTEYDHLNAIRVMPNGQTVGHFLVTGSDDRRAEIVAQGNRLAVNINELNKDWDQGGVARADAMMEWARREFTGGVPEWFFLNEISRSRWLDPGDRGIRYRRYVADVVRRLSVEHGRTVVVFAPFFRPGWLGTNHYPASWRAIAEHAYIGIENYISGRDIVASGFSEEFCRNRYQQSITAYTRLGVPLRRLILTEHFGQTFADKNWGRSEVEIEAWLRAIRVRTRAARSLPFAGYASYGWGSNRTHHTSAQRLRAMDTYRRFGAERLALPDHSDAAATASDPSYDPTIPVEPEPTEVDPDEGGTMSEPAPLPPTEEIPPTDPEADDPTGGCDPPNSIDIGGVCVPSCGQAGGNTCSTGSDGQCNGYALLTSYDCAACCYRDAPTCTPNTCGSTYGAFCGGAPDGCGGTLSCGDTCGDGLNCTTAGLCRKALGQYCAGAGQCQSGICSWVTTPGSAARCCHDVGGWCDSDLKCCGESVCRSGRCVVP